MDKLNHPRVLIGSYSCSTGESHLDNVTITIILTFTLEFYNFLDGDCFWARLVSLLWRFSTKIQFHPADSFYSSLTL